MPYRMLKYLRSGCYANRFFSKMNKIIRKEKTFLTLLPSMKPRKAQGGREAARQGGGEEGKVDRGVFAYQRC
jgi:hypothetical protein